MSKRMVDDNRRILWSKRVTRQLRNQRGKVLPRGVGMIQEEDGIYIVDLFTGEKEKLTEKNIGATL